MNVFKPLLRVYKRAELDSYLVYNPKTNKYVQIPKKDYEHLGVISLYDLYFKE